MLSIHIYRDSSHNIKVGNDAVELTIVCFRHSDHGSIGQSCNKNETAEKANSKTNVGQTTYIRVPAISFNKYLSDSREEQI